LGAAFGQRRKQMRKAMERAGIDWADAAARIGVSPLARAEELSVAQWVDLAVIASPVGHAQNETEEVFDVVDENDAVIGSATRAQVHAENLRHRSVHILVFNDAGELWLQRRSHLKDRCPGLWDSSAAGHLDAGESYESAAAREIVEEMNVAPGDVHEIGVLPASERTGQEFVKIFQSNHNGPFRCPPAEIDGGRFFTLKQIERWITKRPQDFAPGFMECWKVYRRV
jgi:16S rRNA (adenine1518-N6/adenine1519-N6)-dimethyltransferase